MYRVIDYRFQCVLWRLPLRIEHDNHQRRRLVLCLFQIKRQAQRIRCWVMVRPQRRVNGHIILGLLGVGIIYFVVARHQMRAAPGKSFDGHVALIVVKANWVATRIQKREQKPLDVPIALIDHHIEVRVTYVWVCQRLVQWFDAGITDHVTGRRVAYIIAF